MLSILLFTDAPIFMIRMWSKRWFRIVIYLFLVNAISNILGMVGR